MRTGPLGAGAVVCHPIWMLETKVCDPCKSSTFSQPLNHFCSPYKTLNEEKRGGVTEINKTEDEVLKERRAGEMASG